MLDIPLWVLPLVILCFVGTLIYVHKRMEVWTKWFIVLPALGLTFILLILSFDETLSTHFRQSAGRTGFILFFVWLIVILFITRKRHF